MSALYPLRFEPIFKERIWGGRTLEALYGKRLPPAVPIGESWEVSDRPGDDSVVANGPLAGRTLRWLMAHHAADLIGAAQPAPGGRFPLLCKILDARDTLSLQVHPRSPALGEPKTEMWHIVRADAGARLYVGLKRGVTRDDFERALAAGTVEQCFHTIPVRAGDTMFLPSGRVHAIGSGLVIFEIQQNSDTTFRVFDWNRAGLDGRPRDLHVAESLQSIDFDDVEPTLAAGESFTHGHFGVRPVVRHALFNCDLVHAEMPDVMGFPERRLRVIAVVDGRVRASGGGVTDVLEPGQFCVIPAGLGGATLDADDGSTFLHVSVSSATS
jgi:mannose-6-phosphate isomerase